MDIFRRRILLWTYPKLPGLGHRCSATLLQAVWAVRKYSGYWVAIASLLLWVAGAGCRGEKRDRYYLPDGFNKLAHVRFGVLSAPSLSSEDGYRVIRVPPSGEVSTSSPMMPGEGYRDEYICGAGSPRSRSPKRGWTSSEPQGISVWNFLVDCSVAQ